GTTSPWTQSTVISPTARTASGKASPSTVAPGGQTTLTVNVTPGANPSSSGIAVTGDLSGIGGNASQTFYDDGSHGDATKGDNIFTFQTVVTSDTPFGSKSLPISLSDAQGRTGSTSIALTMPFPVIPTTVKISQIYGG